jgi:DNA-binding transcriptional ArsR family regulator
VKSLSDEQLDELLRALSHADRRMFVRLCKNQAVPAGELAEQSQLALASVSEHLKVLRKTGLLDLERDGRFRRYRTNQNLLSAVLATLAKLEES